MPEYVTMDIAKVPDAVRYYTVETFDENGDPTGTEDREVPRCWLFIANGGQKFFLPMGTAEKISELPPPGDGDTIVGYLMKVNPSTGEIRYAHPTDEQHRKPITDSQLTYLSGEGLVFAEL